MQTTRIELTLLNSLLKSVPDLNKDLDGFIKGTIHESVYLH